MSIREVTQRLDATVPVVERDLDARLERLQKLVFASGPIRDALERAIDEVEDEAARYRLRRSLGDLDRSLDDITDEAQTVSAYDLFDPIRILSADLKAAAQPRALW